MNSTSPSLETPKITSGNRWDVVITSALVGTVIGIGIGVIAMSKNASESIAAAAAAGGAGSAIAHFTTDYRATNRRNALRSQLESERSQSSTTISQLQAETQAAHAQYNQLAETAALEVDRLQAELAAVQAAASFADLEPIAAQMPAVAPLPEPVDAPQDAPAPDLQAVPPHPDPVEALT